MIATEHIRQRISLFKGLYLPVFGIERIRSNVPKSQVAQVVVDEYACKGVHACSSDIVEAAIQLASLDHNDVGEFLVNPSIIWHQERWPVHLLRMTQMYPPTNDPFHIQELVLKCGKNFRLFADALEKLPAVIDEDKGFSIQPLRDVLPVLGVRGKLRTHIFDGHHRVLMGLWNGVDNFECLIAYKRLL